MTSRAQKIKESQARIEEMKKEHGAETYYPEEPKPIKADSIMERTYERAKEILKPKKKKKKVTLPTGVRTKKQIKEFEELMEIKKKEDK